MNETKDALQPAKVNDQAATPDQQGQIDKLSADLTAAHKRISALAAAPAESPLSANEAAIRGKMAAGFSREQAMEITNRQPAE